ncbi:hypothetical protein AMECASPLE_037268 [Ameca splendens]|uniref:Uncharacterized protein n=1 Tax=Ameca splendens TaxID=208324 RepID=A0ABV0XWW0_9TELE
MCNLSEMHVMKHVGQAKFRMSREFTLWLRDLLWLSSAWLNPDLLLPLSSGLTHHDLQQESFKLCKEKKKLHYQMFFILQNQTGLKVTTRENAMQQMSSLCNGLCPTFS